MKDPTLKSGDNDKYRHNTFLGVVISFSLSQNADGTRTKVVHKKVKVIIR